MEDGYGRIADIARDLIVLLDLGAGRDLGAVQAFEGRCRQDLARHLEALDQGYDVLRHAEEIRVDHRRRAWIGARKRNPSPAFRRERHDVHAVAMAQG